ncbi:MAG: SIMPL domain-containing protein [Caulobacterales bacterium]|nr:SIMPL domain-containing protein [Caulobacterales bacterium]
MRLFLIAGLLALAAPDLSQAQTLDKSQTIITGIGSVERPAEWATVSLAVVGEGKTSVEALRGLSALQTKLESQLSALVGVKAIDIATSELKVQEVVGSDCERGESYQPRPTLSEGACAVTGYVVTMTMRVKLAPASRAGDAASLAAELGGRGVSLAAFGLNDPSSLRDAAIDAAIQDARAQAAAIAKASGVKLGPIALVSDRSPRPYDGEELDGVVLATEAPAALLAKPPAAPTASVKVTVPPVEETARLSVVFSILP